MSSAAATAPSFAVETLTKFRRKVGYKHDEPKRQRARRDWKYFFRHVIGLEPARFHEDMFRYQLTEPQTMVLAPRGHGKSTVLTIGYSLWRMLRNRDARILVLSETEDIALEFTRAMKRYLESPAWRDLFGDWRGDPWSDGEFTVNRRRALKKESTVTAAGILSGIQGGHYDLVICDDLVSEDQANSEKRRKRVIEKFKQTLLPMLEPDASLHIVGTRYHPYDLYGTLIGKDGMFALTHKIYKAVRDDGSALWPERFPLHNVLGEDGRILVKGLLQIKNDIGTVFFNTQYQNDTEAMKGRLFRYEWFERNAYSDEDIPEHSYLVQAVDPAVGQKETNDYCAIATGAWDYKDKTLYVMGVTRGRWSFHEQVRRIQDEYHRYSRGRRNGAKVAKIGIENNAAQDFIRQHLRRKTRLPVVAVRAQRDKVARAAEFSAQVENGRVRFPRRLLGSEIIEEFLFFPDGAHDDMVDACVHLLSVAYRARSGAVVTKGGRR